MNHVLQYTMLLSVINQQPQYNWAVISNSMLSEKNIIELQCIIYDPF